MRTASSTSIAITLRLNLNHSPTQSQSQFHAIAITLPFNHNHTHTHNSNEPCNGEAHSNGRLLNWKFHSPADPFCALLPRLPQPSLPLTPHPTRPSHYLPSPSSPLRQSISRGGASDTAWRSKSVGSGSSSARARSGCRSSLRASMGWGRGGRRLSRDSSAQLVGSSVTSRPIASVFTTRRR